MRESQPPGKSSLLPSVSTSLAVVVLSSDGVGDVPITSLLLSMVAAAQFHGFDKVDDARYESACTTDMDCEEGLEQDLRLTL